MDTNNYKFTRDGKEELCPLEPWAWMVFYKPTPAQMADGERRTNERNTKLIAELNRRIDEKRKLGQDEREVRTLRQEYDALMADPEWPITDTLYQFDEPTMTFHQVGEIDQDRVELAVLYSTTDPKRRIDLVFQPGMRLIFKYRNFMFNVGTARERKAKVMIFGFKQGDAYCYHYVLPDGRIVTSSDDKVNLNRFGL